MTGSLVSIHDVMPDTVDRVTALVERLRAQGHTAVTLLVVPGCAWQPEQIEQLKRWQAEGLELAAHGWFHRTPIRGFYHRVHSRLISGTVAEHLALDRDGIAALMTASAHWFPDHGLEPPTTYVPPAWALGELPRDRLATLPYDRVEVTSGLLDAHSGQRQWLPLVGFEAVNRTTALFLRGWNAWQVQRARVTDRPLRVAIHPYDPELWLDHQLWRLLATIPASRRTDAWRNASG